MWDCMSTVAQPSSLCDPKRSIGPTYSSLESQKSCNQIAPIKRCGCVLCTRCSAITPWVTVPMTLGTLFVFMETSPAPFLLRLSFSTKLSSAFMPLTAPGLLAGNLSAKPSCLISDECTAQIETGGDRHTASPC